VPWRLEEQTYSSLHEMGRNGVNVRLRRRADREVVHPRSVVVVADLFDLADEPKTVIALACHAEHPFIVEKCLPAQERHQVPIEWHIFRTDVELDMREMGLHGSVPPMVT